jgi:type II secretory pathway component GspD/PulD (secretin)
MQKTTRILAVGLILILTAQDYSVAAAPSAAPASPAAPAATPAGTPPALGVKEPMIEVSVDTLEISESNNKNIGVIWGQSGGTNQSTGQSILDANHLNFLETSVPSVFDAGKFTRSALFAQLQAMITNNQARILANPTLLTKSGFEATFQVGGELPYPTVGQGGVGGVEFKKYGVILKILPQITPRQTVEAQINVSVSNPDSSVAIVLNGTSVPGTSNREAGSKVEVLDGETVVLAGIKQSTRTKITTRVPVLGYIPLLGLLFRSTNESMTQTSLVFFVTFRVVK